MKRLSFVLSVFISFFSFSLFSQNLTARQIVDESLKKGSPQKAEEYINGELGKVSVPAEKRALFSYLASLQELLCEYDEAQKNYASAAGIAAGNAEGMPKKSNEALVLDAVRCALCSGDAETALSYLNSAVRSSKSEEIQAKIKLYEQWARLSLSKNESDLEEPIALLKTYENLSSMEFVKPQILLTLWYVTGEKSYAEELMKDFPQTPESGIVSGKAELLPTPFWFFLPKNKNAEVLTESPLNESSLPNSAQNPKTTSSSTQKNEPQETSADDALVTNESESVSETEDKTKNEETTTEANEKPEKLQLGLFKEKGNASSFVERLSEKGFSAYIQEETRASGTTYYVVLIDVNGDEELSLKLRSAGFDSYPVF